MLHPTDQKVLGSHQGGFTLVELMITILVAAVFMAIALPSFKGVISRTNLRGVNSDLTSTLRYARNEAITRNVRIAVTASTSGNWDDGWNVVALAADPVNNETLRSYPALDSRYKIEVTPAAFTEVKFDSQGTTGETACFTVKDDDAGAQSEPLHLRFMPSGSIHSPDSC